MSNNIKELSIGEVAEATGLTVYTLRQWERRYGHPVPIKRDSGHRRYSLNELSRLRLVAKTISLGEKAKKVVPLATDELLEIIEDQDQRSSLLAAEKWLHLVKDWDQNQLIKMCHKDWSQLGPMDFLKQRILPFLTRIGESWLLGEITIGQEHFFSELLESFLAKKWRTLNQKNSGELFVLASLEGESHCLALHMCALVLALQKRQVLFLGRSTPSRAVISAVEKTQAPHVCVSFSAHYNPDSAKENILLLQKELAKTTNIIVGGQGAPKGIKNVLQFSDFDQFSLWLESGELED